jgi:hypothetical protein
VPEAHEPRATDLVALVTFDEEVRENLAVTREHLGHEQPPPRPLSAAIEQWLHLGRHTWVSVEGREVHGIATARELGDASAWEIDTLIDAGEEHGPGASAETPVLVDLLSRAGVAAAEAQVTRVLLRTPSTVAASAAIRAGFRAAVPQRLWACYHLEPGDEHSRVNVRAADEADEHAAFSLYMRAVPAETRSMVAMTLGEWQSLQEERWPGRGGVTLAAECDGHVIGHMRCSPGTGQVQLLVDPERADSAAEALLDAAVEVIDADQVLVLCETGAPQERILERRGMRVRQEYQLLVKRTTTPVAEAAAVPANARLA